jgi:hypothetical protein
MTELCEIIEEMIMDSFEKSFEVSSEIKEHMLTCASCSQFYNHLEQLGQKLNYDMEPIVIDLKMINVAMDQGFAVLDKRKLWQSNLSFITVALVIFAVCGLIISLDYSFMLLALQVLILCLSPMMIPFAIKKQIQGGTK